MRESRGSARKVVAAVLGFIGLLGSVTAADETSTLAILMDRTRGITSLEPDSDGDALPDSWEKNAGGEWPQIADARPDRKDIFIQVDQVEGFKQTTLAILKLYLEDVQAMFRNAPSGGIEI